MLFSSPESCQHAYLVILASSQRGISPWRIWEMFWIEGLALGAGKFLGADTLS